MKKISMLMAAMALVFSAQASQAEVQAPVWSCALNFDVQGGGLKVLVGKFMLEGQGQISCIDALGNTEEIPVYVTMGGAPVSVGLGVGQLRLIGLASGIGLAGEPTDLLGTYMVAGVRGAFYVGAGADVALHAVHRAFTLNTSVQAVSGFGANIGLDYLTIEKL